MQRNSSSQRQQILRRFGARVAKQRRDLGLSQEVLAELSGLHRTYVGAVERGLRNPTLTSLIKLSRGLGCTVSELLAEVNPR